MTDSRPYGSRVPAERRLLGLDRRTFPLALVVVAVYLVLTVGLPRLDAAIGWDDPVRAGERLALTDTVSFAPVVGWDVETGFRVGEGGSAVTSGPATVTGDGVTFEIETGEYDGSPAGLLGQVEKVTTRTVDPSFSVEGDPGTVTTTAGDTGVAQPYSSLKGDGVVAAFVIDGTGVEVTAYGPPAQMTAASDDVAAMIASISTDGGVGHERGRRPRHRPGGRGRAPSAGGPRGLRLG